MLYLLWLVPAAAAWWHYLAARRRRGLERLVSRQMQAKLMPAGGNARAAWQTWLFAIGLFAALVGAARPQWGTREETVYQRGRDLMVALDVSRSMLANDVHPNRLQRAKVDLMDLVRELRGDRVGLLAFRQKGAMLCPLTTDYAYFRQALEAAGPWSAPKGETDIGDAIAKALDGFENSPGAHKAIVLISDGEDLSGRALDAADTAVERGVPIFTVGLGDRRGSRIPDNDSNDGFVRYRGNEVVTKLDNRTLLAIARKTGGAYIPLEMASTASTTLGILYRDHLRKLGVEDQEEMLRRRRIERYQLFLFPGVLCLMAGCFLSRGRLARGMRNAEEPDSAERGRTAGTDVPPPPRDLTPPKRPPRQLLIPFLLLCYALPIDAQTNDADHGSTTTTNHESRITNHESRTPGGRAGARRAQRMYTLGRHEDAANAYLLAARSGSARSQRTFKYNAAAAFFKAGKFRESANILGELVLSAKEGDPRAARGLGSALFKTAAKPKEPSPEDLRDRSRLLREAAEAFKEAARLREDDTDVRRNLELVLKTLPGAREEAEIAELTAKYGGVPAPALADEMLTSQRELGKEMARVMTNDAPSRIRELERLSEKQAATADLWIPLKGKLLEAVAQQGDDPKVQQQLAAINQLIEATRDNMTVAASRLRDLDPAGCESAALAEAGVYHFWKAVAAFPQILREDMERQTNAIVTTASLAGGSGPPKNAAEEDQQEAIRLTELFVLKFQQAVPEGGSAAQAPAPNIRAAGPNRDGTASGDTNAVPHGISAETRAKILELAGEAAANQKTAAESLAEDRLAAALDTERKAYELLKAIQELLPKQQSSSQQRDQQQEQKQDRQEREQQPQEQQEEQESQQEEQQQEERQEQEQEQEAQDSTPEEVRQLLEKALQREREHEAEKRRRSRAIPMAPNERDW